MVVLLPAILQQTRTEELKVEGAIAGAATAEFTIWETVLNATT